jgi:hypothetical protein
VYGNEDETCLRVKKNHNTKSTQRGQKRHFQVKLLHSDEDVGLGVRDVKLARVAPRVSTRQRLHRYPLSALVMDQSCIRVRCSKVLAPEHIPCSEPVAACPICTTKPGLDDPCRARVGVCKAYTRHQRLSVALVLHVVAEVKPDSRLLVDLSPGACGDRAVKGCRDIPSTHVEHVLWTTWHMDASKTRKKRNLIVHREWSDSDDVIKKQEIKVLRFGT